MFRHDNKLFSEYAPCTDYSFKIFRRHWLAPILRLIRHNRRALTIFGRGEQYTIDSTVHLIGNGADRWYICLETRLLRQKWTEKWLSRLFEDGIAELLTYTEWKKCKNTQNILLDGFYLLFEEYLQDKTSVYILKLCGEIGQSFEESLWGG